MTTKGTATRPSIEKCGVWCVGLGLRKLGALWGVRNFRPASRPRQKPFVETNWATVPLPAGSRLEASTSPTPRQYVVYTVLGPLALAVQQSSNVPAGTVTDGA